METQTTLAPAAGTTPTQMTNPPKDNTHMVKPRAEKKKVQMVKVVCLRPFRIESYLRDTAGAIIEDNSRMTAVGEIVDVTLKRGQELCQPILGAFNFSGERYHRDGDVKRHDLTMARRAVQADLLPKKEELIPAHEQEVWIEGTG